MTAKLVITDHDQLVGLLDDDHTQYHNDARGDARYYQQSEFISVSTGAPDAGEPIVLDVAGHIDASMINDADIDHGLLGGLGDDDHAQYHNDARGDARYLLLDCSNDPLTGYLQTQHLGIMRAPTPNHGQIFSEAFTGTAAKVGYGGFPEFAPSGFAANSVTSIQGNVWFSGVLWGAGSNVKGLDFYPAPLVAGGIWGSANLDITGIATGGLLNIAGRTVTARYVTGLLAFPIANIFGGTDGTTAQIVRGIYVPAATTTTGTWGRLCGMEIEPQVNGVVNEGLRLGGDGIGSDLVFGAGAGTGGDANIFYNGSNLIIDPDLLGSGRVYIGTTGDDDMLLNDIEIDGDLNHDGAGVGFYGTAPIAKQLAVPVTAAGVHAALVALGLIT